VQREDRRGEDVGQPADDQPHIEFYLPLNGFYPGGMYDRERPGQEYRNRRGVHYSSSDSVQAAEAAIRRRLPQGSQEGYPVRSAWFPYWVSDEVEDPVEHDAEAGGLSRAGQG